MITREQKCTLYRLMYKANEHQIKTDDLFLFISKEGPAEFKEICSKIAIDIKKNIPLHEAGKRRGIFDHFESKIIKQAIESGKLGSALDMLIQHHELRNTYHQSHVGFIAPLAFIMLSAIVIHGMPELFLQGQAISTYALKTLMLCFVLISFIWVLGRPKMLLSNKLVKALGIPKLIMSMPNSRTGHAERQISSFTESVGMCKLSGYSWPEAVDISIPRVTNPLVNTDVSSIPIRMKRRDTFEDALKACEYFPESYIKDLEQAVEDKNVPETLIRLKEKQMVKSDRKLKKSSQTPILAMVAITIGLLAHTAMKAGLV